jgi:branched-chain amino acid transport system substrate-binding protein
VTSKGTCFLLVGQIALATLGGAQSLADEVLIGFAGPLTGEMALAGEQMQNGTKLATTELNAAGGVLGQKVTIEHVDDYCDGEQAVAAARKLVADGVAVAIGHLCSQAAIAASAVYEAARIPFLTMASNPLITAQGLHWIFRASPSDVAYGSLSAEYLARQLAGKRIAIIHDTRTYGKGAADFTRKKLEELGSAPVLFEAIQPGQLLFTDLIGRLRRVGTDALYYGGYPREIGLLRRQMAEARFQPPTIVSAANTSEEYGLIAGPAADGTLLIADRRFDTAEFSAFEAGLRETYQMPSDLRVTRGYSNTKIWAQAVEAAGTTDGTAVARTLHSATFHIFGIEARFDERGEVEGPLGEATVWIWRGGKPVALPSAGSAEISAKP